MRAIDADALVEHLERLSEDYTEIHERLKNGDVSKAVMYGKFTVLVETMIDVNRMPTLDCVTQQQWISVNDRLPEKLNENNQVYLTEEVIGYDGESSYIGQFKVYKYDGLRTFFDGNCFRSDVTHWIPLPEPPKED